MTALTRLHDMVFGSLNRFDWLLPLLARIVFAGVLLIYFWNSAMTKLDGSIMGLFSPSFGAFVQIFPRAAEAISYDVTQATAFQKLIVLAGTWAEFILPAMILFGALTRIAALGMIGFVIVQSLTDIFGHSTETGAWFDNLSNGVISDQRAMWIILLLVLVFKGAGPLSVDRFFTARSGS